MSYTLWQGDRLIGETDLANEHQGARYRSGDLIPAPGVGEIDPTMRSSLELRDAGGNVVATEWLTVYDLDADFLDDDGEFIDPLDDEIDAELEAEMAQDEELLRRWIAREEEADGDCNDDCLDAEFSRYQVQLMLAEGAALPD